MRSVILSAAAALAMIGAVAVSPAHAAGCIKGAVVGGVAGHMAGNHGGVGAAAGCAIGHHEANKSAAANANTTNTDSKPNTQ